MKATVREYTVKKKVVVVEIDEKEAAHIIISGEHDLYEAVADLREALEGALEADRAEERRKESEDVPF